MLIIVGIIFAIFICCTGVFFYWKSLKLKSDLEKREKKIKRRMYELAILKELGERIGYSLNIQKIIDIITGSLNQFIEYNAVSYMLLDAEKVLFKVHLEKSVSRKFVDDVRQRMLNSLSALLNQKITKVQVEETLSGALLVDEVDEPVRSFFNIPLIIGDKVVGVLTVAHVDDGLYKEDDMTILYKIIKQASQAVTRLQEVVETEQRKLNAMVETMNEGIIMTDKDYRVMVVNPAAKKIVGLQDKVELSIFDFMDQMEGDFDIRGRLEESVKLDKVLRMDDVLIKKRFFQIFISPVKSSFGIKKNEILGGVILFHDITHDKEVEKMKEDFTSMMVHELRSPLDGIKKMTELISDTGVKKNKKMNNEFIEMIHNASSDMLELVSDLLDKSKIESGKFEIYKSLSDINELAKGRFNFYKTSAKNSKINLQAVLDKRIPKKIDFDPVRITQVLNNFISNALKFTKSDGEIVIQSVLHEKNEDIDQEALNAGIKWFINKNNKDLFDIEDSIIVAVTDSGVGISADNFSNVFDKFKQLNTPTSKNAIRGTGLGLSTAKGIIDAHKGVIGVGSEEGVGSTFYFVLSINKDK